MTQQQQHQQHQQQQQQQHHHQEDEEEEVGAAATVVASPDDDSNSDQEPKQQQNSHQQPQQLQVCSNAYCKRSTPNGSGAGPTCRWYLRAIVPVGDRKGGPTAIKNCKDGVLTLCTACKASFDTARYCPYCVQIYRERDPDSFDGKEWVGCDSRPCGRWVHIDCEHANGYPVDTTAFYLCPACRGDGPLIEERKVRSARTTRTEVTPEPSVQSGDGAVGHALPAMPVITKNGVGSSGPRGASRRSLRVDLSRLETSSLRRYKRVYKLRDVTGTGKEELMPAVARHFAAQVVEEDVVLFAFAWSIKRQSAANNTTQRTTRAPAAK